MLCYHSNDTPQGKTQADTVVLEVTVVNQDKGRLEEGEEDYGGLQREGGKEKDQPSSDISQSAVKSTVHCSGQMMCTQVTFLYCFVLYLCTVH